MAKIKFGMMMTDARGKLGGQVFSKNRSGAYVRTKVTPSNPQSTAQQAIRSILSSVSTGWSLLSASARESFNSAVNDWQTTDIFGDIKNPTGKTLFSKLNINLEQSGQAQITVAPAKVEIPYLGVTAVNGDISSMTLLAVAPSAVAGFVVQVSATPPQSQGTGFYKGKFRVIANAVGADILTEDFWAEYVARFGAPVVGSNIAFQFKLIAPNGQAGIPEIVKATFVA